ncbi:hypothetical protein F4604DRAFT_1675229 [Suillus subluteus]|nr:hypothetical protein F4604DRAFT_1675229 [Suillus subluteus]
MKTYILAPLDVIQPHILHLWKAHQTDKQIVAELQQHFDTSCYGLRFTRTWAFEERASNIILSRPYLERMKWSVVTSYFAIYKPDLVLQRKANCLRRRYGLGLHTGIKPFSGRIMWMRVWHSNRNPQLILSYYLDILDMLGHMPMVTQSDPGSENFGIANAHTMLRQWHDPALQGFESLLDHGVMSGWYDSNNTLQMMRELDVYQDRVNNSRKRRDRNKILPHGVSNLIYQSANNFGALDFKITVEREALDHVNAEIPSAIEDVEEDLQNHQDLPYHEEDNGAYYMGGVGGGLGLGDKHLYQLERLARDDEPETTSSIDEDVVGLDHDGLVIWEFSDDSDGDADAMDEW